MRWLLAVLLLAPGCATTSSKAPSVSGGHWMYDGASRGVDWPPVDLRTPKFHLVQVSVTLQREHRRERAFSKEEHRWVAHVSLRCESPLAPAPAGLGEITVVLSDGRQLPAPFCGNLAPLSETLPYRAVVSDRRDRVPDVTALIVAGQTLAR